MTESPNRDTSNERMSMTIDELIEALGKLSGPDRELDLLIGEEVGAADHSGPASHRPFRDWAKHYTASIDAALTLVPPGKFWILGDGWTHPNEPRYGCRILEDCGADVVLGEGESNANAATAMLIAIFRYRQSPHGEGE